MKTCPILKAGTMEEGMETAIPAYERTECMGEKCEWYGNGCPAHQVYTGYGGKTPPANQE